LEFKVSNEKKKLVWRFLATVSEDFGSGAIKQYIMIVIGDYDEG